MVPWICAALLLCQHQGKATGQSHQPSHPPPPSGGRCTAGRGRIEARGPREADRAGHAVQENVPVCVCVLLQEPIQQPRSPAARAGAPLPACGVRVRVCVCPRLRMCVVYLCPYVRVCVRVSLRRRQVGVHTGRQGKCVHARVRVCVDMHLRVCVLCTHVRACTRVVWVGGGGPRGGWQEGQSELSERLGQAV